MNNLFLISSIIIPKDVSFIARDSFENCNILTINGYIGTYAETYAKENDFEFIAIDEKILTGDANQDGKLSVSDVTALQIYISNNNQKIN